MSSSSPTMSMCASSDLNIGQHHHEVEGYMWVRGPVEGMRVVLLFVVSAPQFVFSSFNTKSYSRILKIDSPLPFKFFTNSSGLKRHLAAAHRRPPVAQAQEVLLDLQDFELNAYLDDHNGVWCSTRRHIYTHRHLLCDVRCRAQN